MAKLGIVRFLKATHGKNMHEHNIKLEFVFEGKLEGDFVSGIDFHEVADKIDLLLNSLQNKHLPDVENLGRGTMENLAVY